MLIRIIAKKIALENEFKCKFQYEKVSLKKIRIFSHFPLNLQRTSIDHEEKFIPENEIKKLLIFLLTEII
jgi:hypothetical protein